MKEIKEKSTKKAFITQFQFPHILQKVSGILNNRGDLIFVWKACWDEFVEDAYKCHALLLC